MEGFGILARHDRRNAQTEKNDKMENYDRESVEGIGIISHHAERGRSLSPFRAGITLTDQDRTTLNPWSRSQKLPHRVILRSKIILNAADGMLFLDYPYLLPIHLPE